jgi:hypothetical protein
VSTLPHHHEQEAENAGAPRFGWAVISIWRFGGTRHHSGGARMKALTLALTLVAWAAVALGVTGEAGAATGLEPVGTYSQPVHVTSDPDDPDRLFVVERAGRIQLTTPAGTSEFLNLTSLVATGADQGLLSVAFPPDHGETSLFYVNYAENPGGDLIVAELSSSGNVADPASLREV